MAKVEFVCAGCGTRVLKYLSQLTRTDVVFCTLSCRNKNYKKVIPSWRPPNYREFHHSCLNCGKTFTTRGSDFRPKSRQYCSHSCKAKHMKRQPHTQETKAKLSAAAARQNRNYSRRHMYNGINGSIQMRSSWEVKFAMWLDMMGISWTYEPEFKLRNGYIYLPDFQLNTGDIIEIKGFMRKDAQDKWDMFCADYPDLNKRLLKKEDLKQMGII